MWKLEGRNQIHSNLDILMADVKNTLLYPFVTVLQMVHRMSLCHCPANGMCPFVTVLQDATVCIPLMLSSRDTTIDMAV